MNTRSGPWLMKTLWLGLLLPAAALGRQDSPPQAPLHRPPPRTTQNVDQADFDTPKKRSKPATKPADTRRLLGQLRKLQSAMHQRLNLGGAQQRAIDNLFTTYLQSLRGGPPRARKFGDQLKVTSGLARLRRQLKAANKARDRQAINRIRQELRNARKSTMQAATPPVSRFLSYLSAELRNGQQKPFRAIVRTLRIGASPSRRSGLRTLWRAVLRPEMELSEDQRKTITTLLRDGLGEEAAARRTGNPGAMTEIGDRVRTEIIEVLYPQQRANLEIALKKPRQRPRPPEFEQPAPEPEEPTPNEPAEEDAPPTTDPPDPQRD